MIVLAKGVLKSFNWFRLISSKSGKNRSIKEVMIVLDQWYYSEGTECKKHWYDIRFEQLFEQFNGH